MIRVKFISFIVREYYLIVLLFLLGIMGMNKVVIIGKRMIVVS